jgi:hypothetical protein
MRALASNAQGNLLLSYWIAGRWAQVRTMLVDEALACDPTIKLFVQYQIGRASGQALEAPAIDLATRAATEDRQTRSWALSTMAASLGGPADAAQRAKLAADAVLEGMAFYGTDDDFVYHWVLAVDAAGDAGEHARVERLLGLVASVRPALLNPFLRAESLRMRATYAPEAQADPDDDLRRAVAGLAAFGAPFPRACAEVTLAERLADRDPSAAAALAESATTTFTELGAHPWVQRSAQVLGRLREPAAG